ncbi:hypothetical protein E2C01_074555 [Portunus trituberculatus]|uniref:Uncharacterized protein n=1 Tax=Portunus trituberculatus TaxID=210409 RepID=A0A5B7IHJ2_PORTR|nr:hypothetical protein [Portunus trituberculatus]
MSCALVSLEGQAGSICNEVFVVERQHCLAIVLNSGRRLGESSVDHSTATPPCKGGQGCDKPVPQTLEN